MAPSPALVLFVALVIVAVAAPTVFAPLRPRPAVPRRAGDAAAHPRQRDLFLLGTDALRPRHPVAPDLRRRFSLFIGVVVVSVSLIGGVIIRMFAGFFRGWIDTVIMRVMDIILAFPSLLLALTLLAILGPGLTNAMIAIAVIANRTTSA